ncbi:ABC transporter permease YtrF precursor [Botrimarina colliarenosi]|uniref:ABC transporter permease YtrF n=1 Tax=Botrimarina colliarenosi TaxID=2528001 RepID=A0A5C6AL06_9BACT|nr:ABC transporter permease [Botrimarina colliarenosi]TWU00158.1 ABC transporter permease YtrF precursor [Botrimarina colliarenosi]
MSLWRIAWKNMQQRGVASSLTVLSMALGVAVMVGVIVIHAVAVKQFSSYAGGYQLIVGGKGGDLQLVLSTVYHLGESRYTLPYSFYREFTDGKYADLTVTAVPYCMGDSFDPRPLEDGPSDQLYRVVATTPDLFDKLEYGVNRDGTPRRYRFRDGRNFRSDHAFEAVLGSVVAAKSGVKVGETINPTHGISGRGDRHDEFLVTGILEPTGTSNDRAVFVNLEGFYLLDGHSLSQKTVEEKALSGPTGPPQVENPRGVLPPATLYNNNDEPIEPLSEPQREVSSILVLSDDQMGPTILTSQINKDQNQAAQAVAPLRTVANLLEGIVGPLQVVLLVLTILIVVVASISILVSIYNSMSERSHDIAVMRALGASRSSVMLVVLSESILLSLTGGVLGIILGHALIAFAAPYIEAQAGIQLAFWEFDPWEIAVIPALVVLATLAGLLPAISAYRTDVAHSLG